MPLAQASLQDRVALYKGDLDGVLQVAIQLTEALGAAVARQIVHRDAKPANILFPHPDHHIWLSDFGVSYPGTTRARVTETGEVVGPRAFIAPELELGGQVPVTPKADAYARQGDLLHAQRRPNPCARAARRSRLRRCLQGGGALRTSPRTLDRMIALLERRIASAAEVREQLQLNQQWEERARDLALSSDALASIDAAQRQALERSPHQGGKRADRGRQPEASEARLRSDSGVAPGRNAENGVSPSLAQLGRAGTHKVEIGKVTWEPQRHFGFDRGPSDTYLEVDGLQLAFIGTTRDVHLENCP